MSKKEKNIDLNIELEKEKLQKIKRSFKPNSDQQQFTSNTKNEFDKKTRKITSFTEYEIDDKLDSIKKLSEEFNWDEILKQGKSESELDKWSLLEKDLMDVVEKYKGQFGPDSYGVIDAIYQIMDGMFQKKESKEEKELELGFDVKSLETDKDEKPSFKTSVDDQEKVEKEFKKEIDKIKDFKSFSKNK